MFMALIPLLVADYLGGLPAAARRVGTPNGTSTLVGALVAIISGFGRKPKAENPAMQWTNGGGKSFTVGAASLYNRTL
jgi:hypothetical protein